MFLYSHNKGPRTGDKIANYAMYYFLTYETWITSHWNKCFRMLD